MFIPVLGILLFLALYVGAAWQYPGGSAMHPSHPGFDLRYNYLCDLLDSLAINGQLNTGRYFARSALFSLCTGLLYLWFCLPNLFSKITTLHCAMWLSGLLALLIIFFMAANNHDSIVRLAGVFGGLAIVTCSSALMREGYYRTGFLGFICAFIFLINYYVYETSAHIETLPLIQKVTFALCLFWFLDLNYRLHLNNTREN
jgi:hypothetical protein